MNTPKEKKLIKIKIKNRKITKKNQNLTTYSDICVNH